MKYLFMFLLVFGLLVIWVRTQLPEFISTENIYLDSNDEIHGKLVEEYIKSLCKVYDNEVYLYIGFDVIPLCKEKDNRGLILFLLALLFKPTRDLMLKIVDEIIPGPEPVITTTSQPVIPTTTPPVVPTTTPPVVPTTTPPVVPTTTPPVTPAG
ncbi:mucin-2-like [Saccostrea echinata]|uniref:mucin-2-like n=1 Tax=Saccostrea echinata TaxID=191078 RepID=UPI002A81D952|nr:mucin-2-like [Saccostrea echinata]